MASVDRFFDENLKQIEMDAHSSIKQAAYDLQKDVQRQIKQKFNNPSRAFFSGIKVHDYGKGVYVRLSPILSSHAESKKLQGSPNLWILLPEGKKRGFKRIGLGFNWTTLKRRYGTRIAFVPVDDGHILLFRDGSSVVPIYKIQQTVQTKQRIEFYERAEEIIEK